MILALLVLAAAPTCDAPVGMACVAAAKAVVGEGTARREVALDAFFIDKAPATAADLAACVKDGACPGTSPESKASAAKGPEVTWEIADSYCVWAGKRLPSESEWELASSPAATSTREWTSSWFVKPDTCPAPLTAIPDKSVGNVPPAQCGKKDALDACDSAFFCGTLTQKTMKDTKTPAARSGAGYLGPKLANVRCVSSTKALTRFPSVYTAAPRAQVALPEPPTEKELAIFNGVQEDVLDTPLCEKAGRAFANCRDPRSYLKTNEPRLDVVMPYLEDLGGGYTGVGSDQSYTFVAQARSRWAWVFDYDPNVVNWHRVLRVLVLASADRAAFVEWFDAKKLKDGAKVLRDAGEAKGIVTLYESSAVRMKSEYALQSGKPFTWLGSDEHFTYVKTMFQQGRMRAFRGNMLDVHAMQGIGAAAKALGVPMRIYYPSNAPEFWLFSDAYRANVAAMPFDDTSIVLQTISSVKSGFGQTGYWHYNVQHGLDHQRMLALPGISRARQLFYHRTKTDTGELTLTALPSAPAAPTAAN